MHHKSKVKKIFKLAFFLIQAMVFVSSITISMISFTVFYRGRFLNIPAKYLFISQVLCTLSFTSSIIGMKTMHSKRRIRMFFYIVFTLILMNLQVLISLKSSMIPEKAHTWGDRLWENMDVEQKRFVQNKFQCCGYDSITDRPAEVCLFKNENCYNVLHAMSLSLRSLIEKTMIFLFITESTGIGILALIKLRR
ncbi:hypothetical protein NGRA_0943 [Nosema granulosis]|uniref:Uncharacterized protein n=1 Tax=Nosema granulosis TaxID=83296 RepID=A0A9P6GZY5_9MICR|nr:hypothetical protein NGRA_0943 [Nosema granulosis]